MADELKTLVTKTAGVDEEAWEALHASLKKKILKKKEHFLRRGDICKHVGFIVSGYVRLYYLQQEKEITKDFNFENSWCGSYASFSLQEPARFNIVAMEDVTVYLLSRQDLYALFERYPSIQKLGRLMMEHMFIKKEIREASFLLDTPVQRYELLLSQDPKIALRVPLKYLASYLGMAAETLSRMRNNTK